MLPLSVLDLSPIVEGGDAAQSLCKGDADEGADQDEARRITWWVRPRHAAMTWVISANNGRRRIALHYIVTGKLSTEIR